MIPASLQQAIRSLLNDQTGQAVTAFTHSPVGGGSINNTYQLTTDNKQQFFCKINTRTQYPGLFEKEKQGLALLAQQGILRTPAVIGLLETDTHQVLVLEWVVQGLKSTRFWQTFGAQLAAQHHCTHPFFGLDTDNYMGALPQYNQQGTSWVSFFIEQRLAPQVRLACDRQLMTGHQAGLFDQFYQQLPALFPPEPPALLHGDLWSGNFLCNAAKQPVLIDPAVYFGHRSMDLAMTNLFGGFDPLFYESYQYHYPLPPGYRTQWEVCNVYPLLIHLNLFGQQYLPDILHTIERY